MKKQLLVVLFAILSNAAMAQGSCSIISTIAGNGAGGYLGDGSAATAAEIHSPTGVATDNSGNVYVADFDNSVIRKISPSGMITTIAGNGTAGFSGDGFAATNAKLNGPYGVAVDGSGNVYIADDLNGRIRKVNTSGIITTIAGSALIGFFGDGGPATLAQLNQPNQVAVDGGGNVYFADGNNNRIRKVNSSGIIHTVAGNGTAGYSSDGIAATASELYGPAGVAVDGSGNIYIADAENDRIRKVNASGVISTLAGTATIGFTGDGGHATAALLNDPTSIAIDGAGNLYFTDQHNNRVRQINTAGIITTVAGNGTAGYLGDNGIATAAEINTPYDVAVDGAGNLYIADIGNQRIRKVSPTSTSAGTITGLSSVCAGANITLTDAAAGVWSSSDASIATVGSAGSLSGIVSGVSAGAATISYGVTNSCGTVYALKTVTVNPVPDVAAVANQAVCNGFPTAAVEFTGSVSGTVFSWINSSTSIGLVAFGTGNIASFTGTNSTTSPVAGVITVTPSASGCTGAVNSFTVTVNPTPVLSGSLIAPSDCSGTLFNYSPTSLTTGATFEWSRSVVSGISNPAALGSGTISEALINTTSAPVAVLYNYTISAFGCTNTENVMVTVNPTPMLSSSLTPPPVCSGVLFSYVPGSTTTGTTFAWMRPVVSGITNPAASGTGSISETLINTTTAPVSVNYIYTLSAYGCLNTQTVTVTVNPLPVAGTITGTPIVCATATTALSDAAGGGAWSSVMTGIATVGTSGIVTGVSAGTTTISYTVTNSCGTAVAPIVVTVNPLPVTGTIAGTPIVCATATTTFSDAAGGGAWTSTTTGIATVGTSGIVTGVSAGTTIISYTVTNSCGSAAATTVVVVNPLPDAGSITGTDSLCPGDTITLTETATGGTWGSSNDLITSISTSGFTTAILPGTDTISYTVTLAGCASTSIFPFIVSSLSICPNSVKLVSPIGNGVLKVYPNPNSGSFTLLLSSHFDEQMVVTITNILGEKVKVLTMKSNVASDVVLDQAAGIYIISVVSADGVFVDRVTVVR